MMAKLRLRELPLTKGQLFAGQWTPFKMEEVPEESRPKRARKVVVLTSPTPRPRAVEAVAGVEATKVIRPPVAPDHVRSVCTADCDQALQDRVHGQSSKNNGGPVYSDPSKPSKTTGPQTSTRVNAGETSDQGNPPLNGRSGVLFPYLSGGQGVNSKSLVERQRDLTLFWVNKLGFLVNEGKSQLVFT